MPFRTLSVWLIRFEAQLFKLNSIRARRGDFSDGEMVGVLLSIFPVAAAGIASSRSLVRLMH